MKAWAVAQGFDPAFVVAATEKFIDYWHAVAGRNGVKLDWTSTWRNWIRNEAERHMPRAVGQTTRSTTDERAGAALAIAARLEAEGR
jgi:hypothetical protein